MTIYHSALTDPALNLAIEEHLFVTLRQRERILFLYSNDPCVVLGRHQNPWLECDLTALAADGVPLLRRISGGGTVYHDHGNTNYCFMAHQEWYDLDLQFAVLTDALAELGIHAELGERHDLWVHGRKCSGTAFRHANGSSLHHGTFLVNADLGRLQRYLHAPRPAGISSRGIASVRSGVMNLRSTAPDVSVQRLWTAISRQYRMHAGAAGVAPAGSLTPEVALTPAWVKARPAVRECAAQRRDWEWVFGHTPPFAVSVAHGGRTLLVTVRGGRIQTVQIDGADAGPVAAHVVGVRLRRAELHQAAAASPPAHQWVAEALIRSVVV